MRYRLMASYLGASYQAAVGPSDRDVTLFAAPPPPEEHGFSPVPGGGIWRKQVRLDDLEGLWESRPIGSYHGEPCLVLDDLGDRLHIVYLGMDERRAGQLGYWQVDRGVFEVVVQRHEVSDLAEERHEFPIAMLLSALPRASAPPRALNAGDGGAGNGSGSGSRAGADAGNGGNMAGRMALASGGQNPGAQRPGGPGASSAIAAWNGQPAVAGTYQLPAAAQQPSQPAAQQPLPAPAPAQQAMAQSAPQAQPQSALPQAPGVPSGAPQASPVSQQFASAAQPGNAQPGAAQQVMAQPGMAQPGMAQQFPGGTAPAAQQTAGAPQPANAQPPAVVAWHGSPVPDGNGTWYYQPNVDPQTVGGTAQNRISQNGISQNVLPQSVAPQNGPTAGGYAPAEQGTPAAGQASGLTAAPQFTPPVQPAPAAGYQQAPTLQQAPAGQQPPAVQQTAQPAAPQVPQFTPPPAAPTPLADAGGAVTAGTAGTAGGTTGPVNLGMPLSGQAPVAAAPAPQAVAPQAVAPPATRTTTEPLPATPTPAAPAGPLGRAASAVRGRRAARKPRLAMSAIFADLVDMADVPRSSYAVDEEVTGAMCLFKTDGGYEVFSCAEDARHEVRFFEDEEAAYFYLFGVLAAEALRNGRLAPRRG